MDVPDCLRFVMKKTPTRFKPLCARLCPDIAQALSA